MIFIIPLAIFILGIVLALVFQLIKASIWKATEKITKCKLNRHVVSLFTKIKDGWN
ncbi:hypothetical protein J6TS2_42370 [Heyndrickxia sporothermodurans]|nr:hypothetical protein J6TS2_42370 [Heyndrickxia sporothermodurans]